MNILHKIFLLCIALRLGLLPDDLLAAESDIPEGFWMKGNVVRVSRAFTVQIVAEAHKLNREESIFRYAKLLKSDDRTKRIYAAYVLRYLHSEESIKALFAQASLENDGVVLREICESLGVNFMLPDFDPTIILREPENKNYHGQIEKCKLRFEKLGYEGYMWDLYNQEKQSKEKEKGNFFAYLTLSNDPKLVPILLRIYKKTEGQADKGDLKDTILSLSGFDLKDHLPDEILAELQDKTALSPEKIHARYLAYFQRIGYTMEMGGAKGIAAVALLYDQEPEMKLVKPEREMAFRLLTYEPNK